MAILHGTWLLDREKSGLFIWGETWRKIGAIEIIESINIPHPLAMSEAELKTFLTSLQQSGKLNWQLPETAETPPEKSQKTRRSPKTQNAAEIPAQNSSIQRQIRAIALPTQISESNATLMPQHSAAAFSEPAPTEEIYLYPWQVEGYFLNPQAAFVFLQSLPLNSTEPDSFVGSDLRFWSHIARWSLDLLARCKFLPGLEKQSDGSAIAKWQPLLDSSTDTLRLATFVKQMPTACRTYQKKEEGTTRSLTRIHGLMIDERESEVEVRGKKEEGRGEKAEESNQLPLAVDLPAGAEELVLGFLSSIVDSQVRSSSRAALTAGSSTLDIKAVSPVRDWLQALQQESGIFSSRNSSTRKLGKQVECLDCTAAKPTISTKSISHLLSTHTAVSW